MEVNFEETRSRTKPSKARQYPLDRHRHGFNELEVPWSTVHTDETTCLHRPRVDYPSTWLIFKRLSNMPSLCRGK